jgi:hypothetical protein
MDTRHSRTSKIIPRIMRATAYASLIPSNAAWLSAFCYTSFVGSGLDAFHGALGLVGIFLLAGYSSTVAGREPWGSPRFFWATSAVFNGGIAAFAISTTTFPIGESWPIAASLFDQATIFGEPALRLSAVAGLSMLILLYWMPVAALLSLVQLGIASKNRSERQDEYGCSVSVPG